jgi:F5/8 type C domain
MDVISLGKSMKAKKSIKKLQDRLGMNGTEQGNDVRDIYANVKTRLEELEKKDPGITLYNRVSEVEANTAINLNKHNLHVNSVLNKNKYGLTDLAFDDFGDDRGIDHSKSTGYEFDSVGRKVKIANGQTQAEVVTTAEDTTVVPRMITVSQAFNEVLTGEKSVDLSTGTHTNTVNNLGKIELAVAETDMGGVSGDITPKMTSNTTPAPYVVSASSIYNSSWPEWKAFNKSNVDTYDRWASANNGLPAWLKLDFGAGNKKIIVKYAITTILSSDTSQSPKSFTFEGSNDDMNWTILDTRTNEINWSSGERREYSFENNTPYRYYRVYITATNGANLTTIAELEMMEKTSRNLYFSSGVYESPILDLGDNFKDIVKIDQIFNTNVVQYSSDLVPNMSSDTSGSITISSDSAYDATTLAWKVFDDSTGSWWTSSSTGVSPVSPRWLKIDFGVGNTKKVRKYTIQAGINPSTWGPRDWILQGSNDDINWTNLHEVNMEPTWVSSEKREYIVDNPGDYRYYRLFITETVNTSGTAVSISEMELFEAVEETKISVYTATSADGITFSNWQPVNSDGTITSPQGRYIKIKVELMAGGEIQEKLIYDFTENEDSNFESNPYVQFNGSLSLKTLYIENMLVDTSFSEEGILLRKTIDKTKFKAIEKIEVN